MIRSPFACIVADPPWQFSDALPGAGRGADKHYPCLSLSEIQRFPLPEFSDDAVLFLWRVASQPQAALDVVTAWGFTPKTEIVWRKLTVNGRRWFGMGRYVRAEHETCIVATRGRPKMLNKSTRSVFDACVPDGRHSAKPVEFFGMVERLTSGPYLEVFARRRRAGWTSIGNEL